MTAFLFSIMRHLCVFMFDFRSCLMCLVYSNYITCKVAQLWIYWIYSSRQFLLQILKPELFRPFFWGGFPYSTTTMEGWPFTPHLSLWRRTCLASGSIGFAHVFRALFHFERLALLSGPGSTVPRHVCRMQQGVPPTAKITKKSGKKPSDSHQKPRETPLWLHFQPKLRNPGPPSGLCIWSCLLERCGNCGKMSMPKEFTNAPGFHMWKVG